MLIMEFINYYFKILMIYHHKLLLYFKIFIYVINSKIMEQLIININNIQEGLINYIHIFILM